MKKKEGYMVTTLQSSEPMQSTKCTEQREVKEEKGRERDPKKTNKLQDLCVCVCEYPRF